MILYLAEARGSEASDWRSIILEPGKLFIVGDPKQSIYAFRRADMEAYDAVVEDHVLAQTPPGERHTLYTNFRGHAGLISSINGFFARIFPSHAVKGIQPKHEPLLSRDTQASLSCEHVEIRLVRPDGQDADADTAGRAEAEELARWLREQVLEREEIYERGVPVKIKPGHVAILFRTLTDMRDYLEALRRYRIPCLTEGEKHFYERQEVIDAINLLRAAVDPHDRLALAGVLRSSLGAMPDVQIESLTRHQLLDYRIAGTPASLDPHARAAYEAVAPIYTLLRELSTELPYVPLPDVMDTVLAKVPLLELAAASIDGEQAVANVLKLRDLAVQLAKQSAPSLRGLAAELTSHALDVSEEAESTLAEDLNGDGQGFVRLLSIHKAKGLEFPMVILAGLQRGANRIPSRVQVHHDWSTGIVGIKVGDRQTLGGIYVSAKLAERQRAEQSRVLYVAMTRAKRRLILSAGIPKQVAQDSFLAMVAQGFALDLDNLSHHVEAGDMSVESAAIRLDVISGKAVPLDAHTREGEAWRDLDEDVPAVRTRWVERLRRKEELSRWPPFLSPTFMKATEPRDEAARRSKGRGPRSDVAALIGTLAHRILERWDFADDPRKLIDQAADLVDRAQLDTSEIQEIRDTINAILQVFGQSEICRTLCQAMIIGREVPFAIPWCGSATQHSERPGRLTISPACPDVASLIRDAGRPSTQHSVCEKTPPAHHLGGARNRGPTDSPDRAPQHSVMEGVIDLVYRFNGEIWIADYKTDRITEEQIADRADEYRLQAEIYTEAVSRCVGLKPKGFQFIFLRTGTVVPVLS
jgi:ATP-dependent helicase/nuclease subunit A